MGSESTTADAGDREAGARRALDSLAEMEPELRAAALFSGDGVSGAVLAATGDAGWIRDAAELAAQVRAAATGEFDSAHIALDDGEAFVIADSGYTLVATTGRFVLAALTRFDARMCLRDLATEAGPGEAGS